MAKYNTQDSIVDYLKSQGQDSSYSARAKMAADMGIKNYSGSDTQNTQLLNAVRNSSATSTISNADTKADAKADNKANEPAKSSLLGVDDETYNKTQTEFQASQDVKDAQEKKDGALSNLEGLTSKEDIISSDVMNTINSDFVVPSAVTKADRWLANQLEVIQSGRTSYTDQLQSIMEQIMNREKFSYDVDTDPLFQQALASAMNSGKQAMQDTIGQASALTGGYGSTYATTAGNQAYNSFIEDAYDNLPQYYQMAMEAYQMEGDEMYRQYGMLSAEDEKEFNRNVAAYDATYQYRNQVYNEAYGEHRDTKNDAFAMANLQLNEHGQRVNDAYNYYNAASNNADTLYEREYNSWLDTINMVWEEIKLRNSDYQNETNRTFQSEENQKQRDWQSAEAEKERAFTASENAKNRSAKGGNGDGSGDLKTPTQKMGQDALKAYNEGNYNEYMASIPDSYDKSTIQEYVSQFGEDWVSDYNDYSGWTIKDDTYNGGWFLGLNWFGGGEDHNDTYSKEGEKDVYTYDQLKDKINASNMPDEKKKELLDALKKQSKN